MREQELRTLLRSIPDIRFVTAEVLQAELVAIERFGSQPQVDAYEGLSPGQPVAPMANSANYSMR